MPAFLRPLLLALAVSGIAAACAFDDPRNQFAEITFSDLEAIRLDVGEVKVERSYEAPGKDPNVDHLFPVKPVDAAQRWPEDRLSAQGGNLVLRYIVREASVTETALETETGVTGLLTTDQAERYEARIVVDLQILDGRQVEATANAEARRFITVPEGISLKERERVWYDLTKNTMQDLNKQLEETIRSAFFPYVVL